MPYFWLDLSAVFYTMISMPKTVIILRGLPGSGKSSVCDLLDPHHLVSMDLFWTKDGSAYNFDYGKLKEAIDWTHQQFIGALEADYPEASPLVVVDNVSYMKMHYEFFFEEARKRGCRVHVLHVERPLEECIVSTKHSVPADKIRQMHSKWEPLI